MTYHFIIPGPPVGKGRPRTSTFRGDDGKARVRIYTDAKTTSFEARVAMAAAKAIPVTLEGPIRVEVVACLARPKRLMRKHDLAGLMWAPTKPDSDNIRKAVLDGMQRVVDLGNGKLHQAIKDDKQVCAGGTLKVYHEKAGLPRTEVWVSLCSGTAEVIL